MEGGREGEEEMGRIRDMGRQVRMELGREG